jgi:hypothetical protein
MRHPIRTGAAVAAVAALGAGSAVLAAGAQDGGPATPPDPSAFTTRIDNPYLPMRPGDRWVYRETTPDGSRQRDVVSVTHRTRRIANGVLARVVRDRATEDGRVVEDTRDWFAQDADGNVWYLGERTRAFEPGRPVSTAGSWEAGVRGARPGIVMLAHPAAGAAYEQEHDPGNAEDRASVLRTGERVEVPAGRYRRVLVTREDSPLERWDVEYKLYAPGVGPVLALGVSGDPSRSELVSFRRGR